MNRASFKDEGAGRDEEDRWVFLLDDDPSVRSGVSSLLEAGGFKVHSFETPAQLQAELENWQQPVVLLVDICLGDANGLDVIEDLHASGANPVAVAMTAYADLSSAISAIRVDVADFLEKPFSRQQLFDAMERAFVKLRPSSRIDESDTLKILKDRYQELSPREGQVMIAMVRGATSKSMARQLGISPRTIEVHRSNVLHKMEAASVVELVHMAIALGITSADANISKALAENRAL